MLSNEFPTPTDDEIIFAKRIATILGRSDGWATGKTYLLARARSKKSPHIYQDKRPIPTQALLSQKGMF